MSEPKVDYVRSWKAANPERHELHKRTAALKKYGITPSDYDALLERQGGVCAVCRSPRGRRRLHVDHDHETGQVRGLLCHRCNSQGMPVVDDPIWLAGLLAYRDRQGAH